MTEDEYCDTNDLATLRNMKDILRELNCFEEPNKTRRLSIAANLDLMIDDVNKRINID